MEHTLESAFLKGATLLIELGQLFLVEEPFPDDFVNRLFGDDALGKMRLSKRTINEFFQRDLPSHSGYSCHIFGALLEHFEDEDTAQLYTSQLSEGSALTAKVNKFLGGSARLCSKL